MIKACCFVLLLTVTCISRAQTNCSYFSNPNNCVPNAVTSTDTPIKSNAQKNANAQPISAQQQSSFTQKNSNSQQEWNTQKKLYTPQNVNAQQYMAVPKKNGTQQNGASQQSTTTQPIPGSQQNANSLLTTNGNGQSNASGMIGNSNNLGNGILKSSQQNLTSTNSNSLSSGATNSLSNGSSVNTIITSPNSLSSSAPQKVRTNNYDDQPAATQKGLNARSGSAASKNSGSSKSKQTTVTKTKEPSNCIFVGMQQVCS